MGRPRAQPSAPTRRTRAQACRILGCKIHNLRYFESRGFLKAYPTGPSFNHSVEYEVADLLWLKDHPPGAETPDPAVAPKQVKRPRGPAVVNPPKPSMPLAISRRAEEFREVAQGWEARMLKDKEEREAFERDTMTEWGARTMLGCDARTLATLADAGAIRRKVWKGQTRFDRDDVLRERDRMLAGKGKS